MQMISAIGTNHHKRRGVLAVGLPVFVMHYFGNSLYHMG